MLISYLFLAAITVTKPRKQTLLGAVIFRLVWNGKREVSLIYEIIVRLCIYLFIYLFLNTKTNALHMYNMISLIFLVIFAITLNVSNYY